MATSPTKVVASPDDPPGEHYVIMGFENILVPGDERSRTHPGHGYPEHTVLTIKCYVYPSYDDWRGEITRRTLDPNGRKNWVPLVVRRPFVTTNISVDVSMRG